MLAHEVPARVYGDSGKRFVALCLVSVTLLLFGIPDQTDLQPPTVVGLESGADGVEEIDDSDTNGRHIALPGVFGAFHGERMFTPGELGGNAAFVQRIDACGGILQRGPPPVRPVKLQGPLLFCRSRLELRGPPPARMRNDRAHLLFLTPIDQFVSWSHASSRTLRLDTGTFDRSTSLLTHHCKPRHVYVPGLEKALVLLITT